MCYGLTDVSAANDNQHRRWQNGFHKNFHLASAQAGITACRVRHTICKVTWLAILQGSEGFLDNAVFQFPTAYRAENVPIRIDQHFAGTVTRRGAAGFYDCT
jgi:hypothetical protein